MVLINCDWLIPQLIYISMEYYLHTGMELGVTLD